MGTPVWVSEKHNSAAAGIPFQYFKAQIKGRIGQYIAIDISSYGLVVNSSGHRHLGIAFYPTKQNAQAGQ